MIKISHINEWKSTRGDDHLYLANFISNLGISSYLMHKVYNQFKDNDAIIQQSIRSYIISIASCLETFYRDLFNYVLSIDELKLESILPVLRSKPSYSDIHSLLKEGITIWDIAVAEANFQNLRDIDLFMSKLFYPGNYLDQLQSSSIEFLVPNKSSRSNIEINKLFPNWRSDLSSIFNYRHSFVHNSNKPCTVKLNEIRTIESVALLIAQITTELIGSKFVIKGYLSGGRYPVLLLIDDLISEDWEIAEDNNGMEFK